METVIIEGVYRVNMKILHDRSVLEYHNINHTWRCQPLSKASFDFMFHGPFLFSNSFLFDSPVSAN